MQRIVRLRTDATTVRGTRIARSRGNPPNTTMKSQDDILSPEDRETVQKLKEAYMQDENLPEDLAQARALAEVNRLAGRTDEAFDAGSKTLSSGEDA